MLITMVIMNIATAMNIITNMIMTTNTNTAMNIIMIMDRNMIILINQLGFPERIELKNKLISKKVFHESDADDPFNQT